MKKVQPKAPGNGRAAMALGLLLISTAAPAGAVPLRAGDLAPAGRATDLNGAPAAVPADFAGKLVVLHFWASWCPPCAEEMKALHSLSVEMRDRGLVPVSIDVGEDRAAVEAWLRPMGLSYPILLDRDKSVAKAYGVTGLPMTFILDRGSIIRYKVLGEINREGLKRLILTIRDEAR
jgi:cytochrome c biogenesis protein CcmG/thiol:disulfide interchange protein DsbE